MLLFQTHIYDVHAHKDATLRRPLCSRHRVRRPVRRGTATSPHPLSALSLHNDDDYLQERLVTVVTAAITRVLNSLVTGSFHRLLIYFLTLVSK